MEDILLKLLLICPITFIAGFIDSIAGGGGLISLPAYFAIGIPPHLATGTNKCSSTFGSFFATVRYIKNGKVHIQSAVFAAIMALFGSYLGATLNLSLDEKYLKYILIFILPITAFIIYQKKEFGRENKALGLSGGKIILLSMMSGFVIGIYDGFFGPGTGTFLIFCFSALIGFDLITSSGNAKIVNFSSNIAALITFAVHGKILYTIGIPGAIFGILGNWIGSGIALKRGTKVIRPMLVIVMGILLIKVIVDLL
ncbi:hypothetical protein EDD66_10428 [Mobilisporobacter senegalensis]|uniref:Probable membrane transporter protein n=1 Tax=Mobilisporobacter senegalensis TaxID=1329262 RepID=A0A3N1XP89_9FIRM|nr:TSUP family transporter [Mobilisporobacter senegalensis]ROR28446.1 hypothetical protein EDD66_10428 [Mobilisporobacter senegalensis]